MCILCHKASHGECIVMTTCVCVCVWGLLQPTYVQPLVAVKLLLSKEDYNTELSVECKIEGSDLKNNDDRD